MLGLQCLLSKFLFLNVEGFMLLNILHDKLLSNIILGRMLRTFGSCSVYANIYLDI